MHAHEKATDTRIESVACVVFRVRCVLLSFDCVASRASVALHVLRTTAWKLHVRLWVGLCDIQLFTFLWRISESAVIRNVVMSNYLTLWRQRPVCQFSWCPQRDVRPLWPVIKLQGDSTSDRQTVASDDGGRVPAWPVIMLLLQTFVIGLGHFWNSRKTVTE